MPAHYPDRYLLKLRNTMNMDECSHDWVESDFLAICAEATSLGFNPGPGIWYQCSKCPAIVTDEPDVDEIKLRNLTAEELDRLKKIIINAPDVEIVEIKPLTHCEQRSELQRAATFLHNHSFFFAAKILRTMTTTDDEPQPDVTTGPEDQT